MIYICICIYAYSSITNQLIAQHNKQDNQKRHLRNKTKLNNAHEDMEKLAKLVLGHFMGFIADTEDYASRDSCTKDILHSTAK